MRKVLHVGPCNTPGGMATVMHTLAEFPPEGWEAELLASHAPGGLWAKWRAYRRARRELKRRCSDPALRPDVVHVHTAADWSWRRKARLIRIARGEKVPCIVHLHSGNMLNWLNQRNISGLKNYFFMKRFVNKYDIFLVSLSQIWSKKFEPLLGKSHYISNPVHPRYHQNPDVSRISGKILMVGRNNPVKGHSFAIDVIRRARKINSEIHLVLTGIDEHPEGWVTTLGWIPIDELANQYQTTQILLMPSSFEGQPLAAIEALSCGASVIVSNSVSSLPATVHSVPFDPGLWVDKIVELVSSNSKTKKIDDLSAFEVEEVQKHWGSVYSSICGNIH
ncbi:MAG: hypothetical protein CMB74_00985 [Euryarchaeota archaeon]|nr:hypothetical protein [Euryarchaeota archaeon]